MSRSYCIAQVWFLSATHTHKHKHILTHTNTHTLSRHPLTHQSDQLVHPRRRIVHNYCTQTARAAVPTAVSGRSAGGTSGEFINPMLHSYLILHHHPPSSHHHPRCLANAPLTFFLVGFFRGIACGSRSVRQGHHVPHKSLSGVAQGRCGHVCRGVLFFAYVHLCVCVCVSVKSNHLCCESN